MTSALLLDENLTLRVAEWSAPEPVSGEAVLRVEYAGLCGSDLHAMGTGAWIEYWPAVLGHEVVGVVQEAADASLVGRRVVVDSRIPCRACPDCARAPRLCANLTWLGESRPGGFASALVVPVTSLVPVPDSLDAAVAVLAEPLAVSMCAIDALPAGAESVLIQGYGPVGALLHSEITRRNPACSVTVVEPQAARRDAATTFGAAVTDAPADSGYDVVIDAAGYPDSVAHALARVRRGGTVLLVGLGSTPLGMTSADIVEKAVTLIGSIGFDDDHLGRAVDALAADPDRYAGLVSTRVPLSGFADFLTTSVLGASGHGAGRSPDALKVIVECAT
ncbi:zinc-dependent alcohol dehydrogenase [Planctomonas psychrotolerans]|uniref:zinc-dependent alcohol dehydrogenase n=1 Tax=Planctomonas psychrotolerans TaxID=2528712 RepID=UPI00123A2234|nr:alcohol dehydrogenase catalytic domain-containing protein [Planctomonas psychrotolerans]